MGSHADRRLPVIDGLRAFAVVAVVLFHGFPGIFGGGYIGVDIFFVISGFVIALRYLQPLIAREIRYRTFFLRRVRRLVPAYFAMLVATTGVAAWAMGPRDLINFGYSLIGQALYAQNIVFWIQGEYFDSALLKPLLHTWSLAVEEQFYLAFPLLVVALRWRPRLTIAACLLLGVAAVAAGAVIEQVSAKTSFYWLPFRTWEFLVGIAAAALYRRGIGELVKPVLANAIGIAALAGIAIAVLAFDDESGSVLTQGLLAVFATAALCLVQGRLSPGVSALFTNLVAQHLGRISYSWYLWHWPPLTFTFVLLHRALTVPEAIGLTGLGYVLGYISWRFLERGTSQAAWLSRTSPTVVLLAAFLLFGAVAGFVIVASNGLVQRYPSRMQPLLLAQMDRPDGRCPIIARLRHWQHQTCPLNDADGQGGILIIGDSHAEMQKQVLAAMGARYDVPVHLAQQNCRIIDFGVDRNCTPRVWRGIVRDMRRLGIKQVVAIALWDDQLDRAGFDAAVGRLLATGARIVLERPTPRDESLAPAFYLERQAAWGRASLHARATHDARDREHNRAITEWTARDPRVTALDPIPLLCPEDRCLFAQGNQPLYSDTHHLTKAGTLLMAPVYAPFFATVAGERAAAGMRHSSSPSR